MKKSIVVLVAAFFIGTLSAFTLKDASGSSNSLFNAREEGSCDEITSNCTGQGLVCEGIQTHANCAIDAKKP